MKNQIFLYVIVVLFISPLTVFSQQKQDKIPTLKGKNVIFVHGGWKGHKPAESADLFVPYLKEAGANLKVFNTLEVYTDEKVMAETDYGGNHQRAI